jgi:hypothetical protein
MFTAISRLECDMNKTHVHLQQIQHQWGTVTPSHLTLYPSTDSLTQTKPMISNLHAKYQSCVQYLCFWETTLVIVSTDANKVLTATEDLIA